MREDKEQRLKKAQEIKRQLELKKIEYLAIKQQNEVLSEQYQSKKDSE